MLSDAGIAGVSEYFGRPIFIIFFFKEKIDLRHD